MRVLATTVALLASAGTATAQTPRTVCAAGAREAVVLVGGYGDRDPFHDNATHPGAAPAGWRVMIAEIERARPGTRVIVAPTTGGAAVGADPAVPAYGQIDTVAQIDAAGVGLAGFLGALRADCGVSRVVLVGFSAGGLTIRSLLSRPATALPLPDVRAVATIGTPYLGAALARAAGLVGQAVPSLAGAAQLTPGRARSWIRARPLRPAYRSVPHVIAGADRHRILPAPILRRLGPIGRVAEGPRGDCVVGADSSLWRPRAGDPRPDMTDLTRVPLGDRIHTTGRLPALIGCAGAPLVRDAASARLAIVPALRRGLTAT